MWPRLGNFGTELLPIKLLLLPLQELWHAVVVLLNRPARLGLVRQPAMGTESRGLQNGLTKAMAPQSALLSFMLLVLHSSLLDQPKLMSYALMYIIWFYLL